MAALAGAYVFATAAFSALAVRAERSRAVYPFRTEDWFRYLLPTLWPNDTVPLLLITGPSTARENISYEVVQARFPDERVFQGALSLGTLADVTLSLEYVEKVYGAGAVPRTIILGLSPRFLAEIPDERGFAGVLERYSPYYRPRKLGSGSFELEPKGRLEGMASRLSFIRRKGQPRYAPALLWFAARMIGPNLSQAVAESPGARRIVAPIAMIMGTPELTTMGLYAFGLEQVSPYKYRGSKPWPESARIGFLDDPNSWWQDVHAWDPVAHQDQVRARIQRLTSFTERLGIALYAVSLPEREESLTRYHDDYTSTYEDLLHEVLAGIPLLDLRCLLPPPEFYDIEHATLAGAARITDRVLAFVTDHRADDAPTTDLHVSPWSAGCSFAAPEP